MLDGEDTDQGYIKAGKRGQQPSRFWAGAEKGEFGERLKDYAKNGKRDRVFRWMSANAAASKLLGDRVTIVTRALPLESALELGIGASTLEFYAKCEGATLEVANFYYEQRGELKADMLKEIITVMREWPEKRDQ